MWLMVSRMCVTSMTYIVSHTTVKVIREELNNLEERLQDIIVDAQQFAAITLQDLGTYPR